MHLLRRNWWQQKTCLRFLNWWKKSSSCRDFVHMKIFNIEWRKPLFEINPTLFDIFLIFNLLSLNIFSCENNIFWFQYLKWRTYTMTNYIFREENLWLLEWNFSFSSKIILKNENIWKKKKGEMNWSAKVNVALNKRERLLLSISNFSSHCYEKAF